MSAELPRVTKKVQAVSKGLEYATDQLRTTQPTQHVADVGGRFAVPNQAQHFHKTGIDEKLGERDAAISNLLQTVKTNENTIQSLKSELDSCKKYVNKILEENRRLQHESEIFGESILGFMSVSVT